MVATAVGDHNRSVLLPFGVRLLERLAQLFDGISGSSDLGRRERTMRCGTFIHYFPPDLVCWKVWGVGLKRGDLFLYSLIPRPPLAAVFS